MNAIGAQYLLGLLGVMLVRLILPPHRVLCYACISPRIHR